MNILLDEFEEKAGAAKLSQEYFARRHELNDRLSRPVPTASIDEEISELRKNMSAIESRISAGRARIVSEISELKAEQTRCSGELEREQRRVAGAASEQNADSIFDRLFGRNKSQANNPESRIKELESKLAILSNEVLERQKQLKTIDIRSSESGFAEEWDQLESIQTGLVELENERVDRVQLVKERAEVTASMAEAISRIP